MEFHQTAPNTTSPTMTRKTANLIKRFVPLIAARSKEKKRVRVDSEERGQFNLGVLKANPTTLFYLVLHETRAR
jgi:hypothetical protein